MSPESSYSLAPLGNAPPVAGLTPAEQLRLLQTCVGRLDDIIVITEADPLDEPGPRIVFVNEAFTRRTGWTVAEVLGRSPRMLQGPGTDRATLARIRAALERREPVHEEILNYAKDGQVMCLEMDILPVPGREGRPSHFVAVMRDVTERRRVAEALRRSEETYRLLFRDNPQPMWVYDPQTLRFLAVNRAALAQYGWSEDEFRAMTIHDIRPPEDVPRLERKLADPAYLRSRHTDVWRHRRKDGAILEVEIISEPFTWEDLPARLVLAKDLTERRQLEAKFLRAQRLESIGTLAGGIAHDLNNVLAPVMMSVDLLRAALREPSLREVLDALESSVRRGADMVRQILTFARGLDGRRVAVPVGRVVRDVQRLARETFAKNVTVTVSLAPGLWPVTADPTQLHQLLLNLCVNARDAMPEGGELTISAANVVLDAAYAAMTPGITPGRHVHLRVSDTGTGIPASIRDKIFDPFFTTKEPGLGTGLGLATVLTIAASCGGSVRVESEEGRGSAFEIHLPAAPDGAAAEAEAPRGELPRGRGELVLVVDDEAAVRLITQQTLEAYGYRALTAEDGASAVAVFATQREVALVLTDMMMPVMDGFATIQALRRIRPDVRVVAASGMADGPLAKAAGAGVRHILPKPYTADTLLRTIQQALAENSSASGAGGSGINRFES